MFKLNRSKPFIFALCVAALAVLLATGAGIATLLLRQTNTVASGDPIRAAMQRARQAGAYQFNGDVTQVTLPTARITNVGRASRSQQLYIEGQTDVRQNTLEMKLWGQDGSVIGGPNVLGVKVENGKSYMRQGATGAWKENSSISTDGIAPNGDFMSFLRAVRNVQAHAPETRAGLTFVRYSFEVDGPAFAAFVRDQMQAALQAKGELVPGTHLDVPARYSQMTGDGELWVRVGGTEDGLPLRQILNLNFPDLRDSSQHAQIKINFTQFAPPAVGLLEGVRLLSDHLPSPITLAIVLLSFSAAGLLFCFYASRRFQRVLTVSLITMMVSGPALSGIRTGQIVSVQIARAASEKEQQKEIDAATALKAMDASAAFSPHQNPVQAGELRTREEARLASAINVLSANTVAAAPAAQAVLPTDNGADTDSDGLSDFAEQRVGTDPTFNDSDEDGLLDGVEVKGFAMGGKTWYLNPLDIDSNKDGLSDALEYDNDGNNAADDTDADGLPDVFDADNDGDGVPDDKDTAPFTRVANVFGEGNPMNLILNNLQAGKATFVDFQVRPQTASHLWYAFNVLDWPQDTDGQMRDVDGKTFADLGGAGANEANGDMRLIPMLEIRVPNNGANVPLQADLTPYNITVNNLNASGSIKVVYVPLSVVTDEKTGERVAFNARMRYAPTGSWPLPHEVRMVWNVLALSDVPCDPQAPNATAQGCQSDGYIHNAGQVLHSYADSFTLTGLNVTEDNGAGVAIVYEDPAVDTNKKDDTTLMGFSHGLDNSFLAARDEDNNGARDVTLSEIQRRFDRNQNSGVSSVQRWGLSNVLRVELTEYDLADKANVFTAMTETKRILNTVFGPSWQADKTVKPLLLFAQEQRFRGLNLDGLRGDGNFVTLTGSDVIFNMAPAGQTATPVIISASAKWMPYCAPNAASPTWAPCEADAYWAELETRHGTAITLAGDPADPDVAAGRVMAMQMYVLALMQGVNRVVQSGNTPILNVRYTLKSDSALDAQLRILSNVGAAAVGAIASEVITAKFVDKVTMLQHFGRQLKEIRAGAVGQLGKDAISILKAFRSGGHLNRFVGTAIVGGATAVLAGIVVGAYFLANAVLSDDPATNKAAKITIRTLTVAITTYLSTISPLMELNDWRKAVSAAGSTLRLGSSIKAAALKGGAVATLLATAITWGFFIYAMVQNNVSAFSPEFNKAFAEAIATTIYLLVTLLISSTVIGTILVAIIAAIDAILTAICELGVDELRTVPGLGGACFTLGTSAIKILAYLIYNYEPMVDTSRSDMVVTGKIDVDLADPSKGYVAGNSVTVSLPITTNIRHKNPDPAEGLLINFYLYLFSPSNLRSSTYAYSLSKADAPQALTVARDQMTNAWTVSEREDKYVATTMYKGYATTNPPAPVSGIPLTAGINKAVEYNMNMGYAIPAYECWLMPLPFIPFVPPIPVCYTRELAGTTSTKFDNLKYDIYPATLDGFMTLSNKGANGLGLGWDASFDALADADGDGLISTAKNGIDPNDATWDADGDGLSDAFELERRQAGVAYSPISCDTDLDGLADKQEMEIGSDPAKADSDNDGLKDGDEVWHLVYTIATANNVTTCAPTANSAGGWDVTINAATPFVVRVSSNPLLADGDSDGVSDLAEKQLAQSTTASQRVDTENRPYHPNILNTPPVQVYTQIDDRDGIIAPNQSIVHTTTIVASAPLSYAVLDMAASAALGPVPGARSIPLVATTPQTATLLTNFTVQNGAATQNVAITSSVRSRLGNTGTPGYVFEPIVSEAALGSFVAPNAARSVGLSPARPDRQDNYFLTTLTSDSGAVGGNGDVVNFAIPSGANSAIENDGNNVFAKRGNTAPAIATNNNGDSLIVWEQKERCNVITLIGMTVVTAASDANGGIEPVITLKSDTATASVVNIAGMPAGENAIWWWGAGGGGPDMRPGESRAAPSFGFPIARTVCGQYTLHAWESDGGVEDVGAQTIDSMAALGTLTLNFEGSGHKIAVAVTVAAKDEYVLSGALVGADGAVKKRLSFTQPPVVSPLYKTKSFGPSAASDGSGFLVAYEAIAVNRGPTQQWVGETDGLTYLAAQAFDPNGNATGNSAGFAYFQNPTGQRSMAHSTAWLGSTYRTVLKALNHNTIDFVDFSATAALGATQFGPNDGTTGTDPQLNAPQIAYDPTSGRWLMAYVKSSGQAQFNVYPNVGSITPSAQQTGSAGAVGVSAAFNPISQGWLVAGLFNTGLYSVNPVKLNDLTAQTPTFQGWTLSGNTQPPAMACPLPVSQPVLDLGFEEVPGATTYVDASGFGNNATCGSGTQCPTNGASGAVDANGIAAGTPASDFALQFNGNQYLRIPNSARLQWGANDSLTWLTWVKVSSGTPIMRKGLGNANDLVMSIANEAGQLRMAFGNTSNTLTAGPDLRDNKWHQVAATLNRSTGVAALIVDGVSRGTGGFSGSFVTSDDLFIGSNNATGFVGLMDGVQLYRSALGADAVKALYDRTQQNFCVAARPTANGNAINWAKLRITQPDVRGGKVTASSSLTLTIDGDAPRSALTSVQNNQFVDNSPTSRNVDRILVIGGSATDSTSGISKVEVSVNGGAWQPASGDESWTYPLVLNLRGFGSENEMLYRIRTRATDSVGNVETPGAEIIVRGDLEDPVLDFADPAPRITRNAAGQWVARITGSGHDGVPSSGVKSILVQLFTYASANNPYPDVAVGGQQRATVTANTVAGGFNNFNWAIDYVLPSNVTDAPPSGNFLVVVRIDDNVGQKVTDGVSLGSQQRVVRLDGAGPNAAMTTSDAARGIHTTTITSTVTIAGVISDTGGSGLDKLEVAFVPISQVLPYSDTALLLRLDEGAGSVYFQDASGQFNNAYCPNTAQCITAGVAARIGSGASLNGNQYVRVKNAPSLNFDGGASFTWMAWVKTNTGSPILRKGLSGANDLMLSITSDTGQLRMAFGDPNGTTTLAAGPNLRDNQWHHVAATLRRSDGRATLYVDGVAQGSGTFSGGFVTPDDLFVGSGNVAGFNGSLDEVTIFRHALSAADVLALARAADRAWLPAALSQRGADIASATWSLGVPAGLEGIYQIDLRGYDVAGNRQLNSGAWRGIADGVAPRVTFTGAATGQSFLDANTNTRQYEMRYTCKAEDWQLNEASFDCPGNSQQTPTRGFNTDPTLLAQFPSLSVLNAMTNTYTVWQANTQPVGSARACDATGKCSTATATAGQANLAMRANNKVAFGANAASTFDTPNAVIVDPTDGNVIALLQGNQNLQVTVAGEASNRLKTIELFVDDVLQTTIDFAQADVVKSAIRTVTITPTAAGQHVLTAKATDWAGHAQVDATPVTITVITGLPEVEMDRDYTVLTDTYGLRSNIVVLRGTASTAALAAVKVRVNGGRWADARFGEGRWEIALPVRDLQGQGLNVTLEALDLFGQVKQHSLGETVMLTDGGNPPDTAITEGPSGTTDALTATARFSGTEGGREIVGFECAVDESGYAPCISPFTASVVSNGEHTLRVRAVDADGYVDPTPASATWAVRMTMLETTLTSAPSSTGYSREVQFEFEAEGASSFECALDGSTFTQCSSPQTYSGLEDGAHEFLVRAKNEAGWVGAATRYVWSISNSAPVAADQDITVASNQSVAITLGATDADALRYKLVSKPSNGVLFGLAPNVTYVPNTGFVGEDSFTFKATDTESDSEPATVRIKVTAPQSEGPSTLTIVLDAQPDAKQNFRFVSNLGNFRLDDASPDDGDEHKNSITFEVIPQRTYVFEEQVPGGWQLADIVCDTPHQVNVPAATAEIVVNNNEEVTCTFVNVRDANRGALGEPVDKDEAGYDEIAPSSNVKVYLPMIAK